MTVLEFWGCALITFGPAIAMFSLTVAHDPIKVILLISSSFFWLLSFLLVAICWAVISSFCDYLIIGAYLAVLSQEGFRYLFHLVTKKAQVYLAKIMNDAVSSSKPSTSAGGGGSTSRVNEIQQQQPQSSSSSTNNNPSLSEFRDRIPLSYGKCHSELSSPIRTNRFANDSLYSSLFSLGIGFWTHEWSFLNYEHSYRLHWARYSWPQGRLNLFPLGLILNRASFYSSKRGLVDSHVRKY